MRWLLAYVLTLTATACGPQPTGDSAGAGGGGDKADDARSFHRSHCFAQHLMDAVALNEARLDPYSKQSAGRSVRISVSLIAAEQISQLAALLFDAAAWHWQKYGVPVGCDEFVSMTLAPRFQSNPGPGVPLDWYESLDGEALRNRLASAAQSGDFESLDAALDAELAGLSGLPMYHCMTRHLLDSMRRISGFAPIQIARAADRGLESPAGLSKILIDLHLDSLPMAARLDDLAAPLQSEGIPIICHDVPPIAAP